MTDPVHLYAIWWLTQDDTIRLRRVIDQLGLPDYMIQQFFSRAGRAGRGRLWTPGHIPVAEIEWPDTVPSRMALDCGGIVFEMEYVLQVIVLPGFVTTLDLQFVNMARYKLSTRPLWLGGGD